MARLNILIIVISIVTLSFAGPIQASIVSGDPSADAGWSLAGHSLDNGIYVKGSANYGFDAYSAGFQVQSGSNLDISDGPMSWLPGDTVIGVGGKFRSITAAEAGWGSFSGNGVNALLPAASGPKLQAKFGTANATWSTSTVAPGAGNGNSSSSSGGGRVQVRTSAYFQAGTPTPGQTEPWTWDGNSGQVLVLDKSDHINWDGVSTQPDKRAARMIWNWNGTHVASWELLLNVSLLDRIAPGDFMGLIPGVGDQAILTVQNGDSAYTDALISVVPEPATLGLLAFAGLIVIRRRSH